MNEFKALDDKDALAVSNNGWVFDLSLEGVDEMLLHYKDGMFHILTGEKEKVIVDGFQTGDTLHTGISTNGSEHTITCSREFNGRMEGRMHKTDKKLLDKALNEYEAALARKECTNYFVLPKWAKIFNVRPNTVQGWMIKHRTTRKKAPGLKVLHATLALNK